jgi:hypothetical protein
MSPYPGRRQGVLSTTMSMNGIAMLAARAKAAREGLAIARHNFLQPVKSLHIMIA